MNDLTDKSVFDLASRLNQISIERQQLDIEYNAIVHELWNRIPSLKDNTDFQPKVLEKAIGKGKKNERS